jgi:hypothetical protein
MKLEARWLWQGHFSFANQERGESTAQKIRDELARRLGQGSETLRIGQYRVGPQVKHTYWWRESERDHAEAQFFARVSGDHPVLSLGVSVEKGLEDLSNLPAAKHDAYRMDRKTWDWPKLLKRAEQVFTEDLPASAVRCERPVSVRLVSHRPGDKKARSRRSFVLMNDKWFERHEGSADVKEMVAYLSELDGQPDWWVNVYIGCVLAPGEVEGMEPAQAADILMCFANVRERLRK